MPPVAAPFTGAYAYAFGRELQPVSPPKKQPVHMFSAVGVASIQIFESGQIHRWYREGLDVGGWMIIGEHDGQGNRIHAWIDEWLAPSDCVRDSAVHQFGNGEWVRDRFKAALNNIPIQLGAVGQAVSWVGASQVIDDVPSSTNPSLHVKLATLPWRSPLDLTTLPLVNVVRPVHDVAVQVLLVVSPFQVISPVNPVKQWHAFPGC